jgi:hypothetical protein
MPIIGGGGSFMMVIDNCKQWRELSDLAGAFLSLQTGLGLVEHNPYAYQILHEYGHREYKTIPLLKPCFR